jgi:LacI family transcriptional regulator
VRRRDAFLNSVKKIGLPAENRHIFIGDHTFEGGTLAALHFLKCKPRPTAIVCSNDMMAIGVLRVMTEREIRVPGEISVVGFDDIHLAEFTNPPLTTVSMSRQELAHAAYRGLERLWAEGSSDSKNSIHVRTGLVIRQSTDSPLELADALRVRPRSRKVKT